MKVELIDGRCQHTAGPETGSSNLVPLSPDTLTLLNTIEIDPRMFSRNEDLRVKKKAEEGAMTKEELSEVRRKGHLYRKQKKLRKAGEVLSDQERLELVTLQDSTRKSLKRARQQLAAKNNTTNHPSSVVLSPSHSPPFPENVADLRAPL